MTLMHGWPALATNNLMHEYLAEKFRKRATGVVRLGLPRRPACAATGPRQAGPQARHAATEADGARWLLSGLGIW